MQQASFVLARLDCVLLTRQPIDNADAHAGVADAVAQLGREIPLDLLSRESADAVEQWRNAHFGPALGEQRTLGRDGIARIAFAYDHLIRPPTRACRSHHELFADGPEAQEPDAELALQSGG